MSSRREVWQCMGCNMTRTYGMGTSLSKAKAGTTAVIRCEGTCYLKPTMTRHIYLGLEEFTGDYHSNSVVPQQRNDAHGE